MESYHGKNYRLGFPEKVAGCADCHTAHSSPPRQGPQIVRQSEPTWSRPAPSATRRPRLCSPSSIAHGEHNDREQYPILFYTFIAMTGLLTRHLRGLLDPHAPLDVPRFRGKPGEGGSPCSGACRSRHPRRAQAVSPLQPAPRLPPYPGNHQFPRALPDRPAPQIQRSGLGEDAHVHLRRVCQRRLCPPDLRRYHLHLLRLGDLHEHPFPLHQERYPGQLRSSGCSDRTRSVPICGTSSTSSGWSAGSSSGGRNRPSSAGPTGKNSTSSRSSGVCSPSAAPA